MLKNMTSLQVLEWRAYYLIEPFGEKPKFLRTGIIASVIANVHRSKKDRTFAPEDFMPQEPRLETGSEVQSTEEQKTVLKKIFSMARRVGLTKRSR